LTDYFVAGEPRHPHERVVDADVGPVRDAGNRRRLRIQVVDGLEPPFGCAERVFGQPPVVDVERGRDPPRDPAALVRDGDDSRQVPPVCALRVPDPILELARLRPGERLAPDPRDLTTVVRV
jgi:hypothetical protein